MNSKHTPGPWDYNGEMIFSSHGEIGPLNTKPRKILAVMDNYENWEDDASRVVDCVNACEGINPDAVHDLLEALENNFNALQEAFIILNDFAKGKEGTISPMDPTDTIAYVYQTLATIFEPTKQAINQATS